MFIIHTICSPTYSSCPNQPLPRHPTTHYFINSAKFLLALATISRVGPTHTEHTTTTTTSTITAATNTAAHSGWKGDRVSQPNLANDLLERLLLGLGDQVVLPDEEDEVLEGGVEVRHRARLLQLQVVVVVHDREDAEQPRVDHFHRLHEVLGEGRGCG